MRPGRIGVGRALLAAAAGSGGLALLVATAASVGLALAVACAAAARAPEPPAEAVLAELPFLDTEERNRIYLDLAPAGSRTPFRLFLDTGASGTVFTPRAARANGVSVRREKSDLYRRSTRLGRDILFRVDTRSSDTASKTGWEYGLLGGSFLAQYVVEIDFASRLVRFLDPERYEVPAEARAGDEAVLPIELVGTRPGLRVDVGGQPLEVLLDTGAPFGLMLSGEVAAKAGVESSREGAPWVAGVLGSVETAIGEVAELRVGPFVFPGYPVVVSPSGFFNVGLSGDSILGVDLLAHFLLRIDYPRERLWLRRIADTPVTLAGEPWPPATSAPLVVSPVSKAAPLPPPALPAAEALEPARAAPAPAGPAVWIELAAPGEGEIFEGPVAWLEVRGWAGAGTPIEHDVVIVVDVSGSTMYASGADVDDDGKTGRARRRIDAWRSFNPRHYSSDPGDTILAAELLATRRLVDRFDLGRTRVGLLSFSEGVEVLAPLGSDRAAVAAALARLEENFGSGATNLEAATRVAVEALLAAGGTGRRRSALILSDGLPTLPNPARRAAEAALDAARAARDAGVRLYTFELGELGGEADGVYAAMAELSGGRHRRIPRPAEIVHELPRIDLAEVAGVGIANLSTGAAGRATRVFPDGTFDGFVALAAGENRLRVSARGAGGGARHTERTVVYAPAEPADEAERLAFEAARSAFRKRLETRALESRLAAEARGGRRAAEQRRELEVEVDREAAP